MGCDISDVLASASLKDFNPRTHVGCDPVIALGSSMELFQSTHPRGVRHAESTEVFRYWKFQSTHPRGVRPLAIRQEANAANFNPRTHVGCDSAEAEKARQWQISIHAPTWGATQCNKTAIEAANISIHAPTWGATVKPSNDWLLGHKDNEFANENIIIINSVNIT